MMRPDWDKITEEAFNSEEVHDFSADYCRRRAELQGGTSMEKRRITQKTRRFNTRIAATAAALLIIPTATVGALHFAPSGDKNDGKKLGAAVEEATALTEGDETSAATEPETETVTVTVTGTYAVAEAETLDPAGAEEEPKPESETAAEPVTTVTAPEQETADHPMGEEVPTQALEAIEVPRAIVALDDDDPSYLKGNYQMVFHNKVPDKFVAAEGGILYYDPPVNVMDASIAPSWFYNVNGSYDKICKRLEADMGKPEKLVLTGEYGRKECEIFGASGEGESIIEGKVVIIKFPETNFVGELTVHGDVPAEALSAFINAIDLRTKAQLNEPSDYCLLVGGPSTNGPEDPEAACLDSDVFH